MNQPKLIINVAPTGNVPTRADNPNLPITPTEIARDCERAYRLGATVFHLHARDGDGKPTYRKEIYAEIICKVRDRCPDAIIGVSTSGRAFRDFEQRTAVLDLSGDVKPDMASLKLGSFNFPKQASIDDPATIRGLAERMNERGIVPELAVFELGMIDYAKYLIDKGVLRELLYFNILLGSLGTLSATPLHLALAVQSLPPGSVWGAAGIGRFQFGMNALAIAMGGHVRVGLEDALFMDAAKTRPATNPALVERLAHLASAVERDIATPAEAREMIGLPASLSASAQQITA